MSVVFKRKRLINGVISFGCRYRILFDRYNRFNTPIPISLSDFWIQLPLRQLYKWTIVVHK